MLSNLFAVCGEFAMNDATFTCHSTSPLQSCGVHTSLLGCTLVASTCTLVASTYTSIASTCTSVVSTCISIASTCTLIASTCISIASTCTLVASTCKKLTYSTLCSNSKRLVHILKPLQRGEQDYSPFCAKGAGGLGSSWVMMEVE